jgi:predicted phage terminase large subunit-like protein
MEPSRLLASSGNIRKEGEALHAERDSVETYRAIREAVGEYNFESQYQQSPISLEGGLIKREWLQYYDPAEKPDCYTYTLQSWDTANKNGALNDFSVCTTWGVRDGYFYLLDVHRRRYDYPALKRAAVELSAKFKPTKLLIEDKSSGSSLIQELRAVGVFRIEPYVPPPGSDKGFRFAALAIHFEAGRVLVPRQAAWLDEYVLEITGFPGTKYDDQVDSTSQALEFLATKSRSLEVWKRLAR